MSEDNLNGPPSPPSVAPEGAAPESAPADTSPVPSRKRWIAAAAAALGVALFAVPLLRGPENHMAADSAADHADSSSAPAAVCNIKNTTANFDFTLKDSNGASVKLADYKGKVVLLNFWATWCGPCKVEIPEFVEAYRKYRDRGFVILGVLSEDDPSVKELRDFMAEFKMNYPVLQADEQLEASFGSLWALPTTFMIDRKGQVCTKHMGPVSKDALEREINGLL